MINKIQTSIAEALAPIKDGAHVLVGGFGEAGIPYQLLQGLLDYGSRELNIISNNAGTHGKGIAGLLLGGQG